MSIYSINKGINRPMVFKGLKAQYIGWIGIGLVSLLLLFAILYIVQIPTVVCMVVVFGLGGVLIRVVFNYSKRYGEHGLMKKMARKYIPKVIKCDTRFK